ncbi:MAG: serine/threonine protein kinase [Polyangiaceae bacterium]|nr:serine/threonine protein kinase [Polyangiaceae bacterium]
MAQLTPDSRRVERIGDYLIHRVIGEGGMGIVYEASERLSGRRVALKVLHSSLSRSADARDRFFNEMRILARLDHPNVVRSLSSFEAEGKLVIVLELLEGRTLRDALAAGGITAAYTVEIASAVASALVAAHEREPPIVHRDLKPENFMLLGDGTVKVMDFGVAKVLADNAGVTAATQVVGTVQYMAPEQAEGRAVTPKTDVYALGLLMYEMLAGRRPFESPSLLGVLKLQCEAPPPPLPEDVRTYIPAALESLLFATLEKAPERRPNDVRTVLETLQRLGPHPGTRDSSATSGTRAGRALEGAPPVAARTGKPRDASRLDTILLLDRFDRRRRGWVLAALGVLVVAAIATAAVLSLWPETTAKKSKKRVATSEPTASALPIVPDCPAGQQCKPFSPPDPTKVEADLVIDESTSFARSIDPNAKLASASFVRSVRNGFVDLTDPEALVTVNFVLPVGGMLVMTTPQQHRMLKFQQAAPDGVPLEGPRCSLKRAFDAASAAGFPLAPRGNAFLSPSGKPGSISWVISSPPETVSIDARNCAVLTKR